MTPEELKERRNFIGASESAAATGLSQWKTPFQLWREKLGEDEDEADTRYTEWGKRLEPIVLRKYQDEKGVELQAPCAPIVSRDFPWMRFSPDAMLPDRLVEAKTARSAWDWGEMGSDQIPLAYLIQVMHGMVVSGRRLADVAVLISGHDFRIYTIPYDEELAQLLIDREREFWQHVQDGTPPAVKSISDAQARWPKDSGVSVVASQEIADAVVRLAEVKAMQEQLEADADALSLAIRTCMAEATTLTDSAGTALATWKAQMRSQFDFQSFKSKHPGLHAEFTQKIPTRVFRLSKGKQT